MLRYKLVWKRLYKHTFIIHLIWSLCSSGLVNKGEKWLQGSPVNKPDLSYIFQVSYFPHLGQCSQTHLHFRDLCDVSSPKTEQEAHFNQFIGISSELEVSEDNDQPHLAGQTAFYFPLIDV